MGIEDCGLYVSSLIAMNDEWWADRLIDCSLPPGSFCIRSTVIRISKFYT